jgi:hypothetical protein
MTPGFTLVPPKSTPIAVAVLIVENFVTQLLAILQE